jgi:hypothetical protein
MNNSSPESTSINNKGCRDWFYAPAGCLLRISPFILLGFLILSVLGFLFIYYNANIDLWGIGRPDFSKWVVTGNFEKIQDEKQNSWVITYESNKSSQFSGLIRHVNPIREGAFIILTHDILVTSGDFADPSKVETNVANHHFTWRSFTIAHPQGTINLLHIVPANEEIYKKLLQIQAGSYATISGREILKIESYDSTKQFLGAWQDTGCNSILVTSVEIK